MLDQFDLSIVERYVSAYFSSGYDEASTRYFDSHFNDDPGYYYAFAVIYADMKESEKVYLNLGKALEMGYDNYDYLKVDFSAYLTDTSFHRILMKHGVPNPFFIEWYNNLLTKSNGIIKQFVEEKINTWQENGKFEKTTDYLKRVSPESRQGKINYYTQKAIDSLGMANINWGELVNEYDADNESFRVSLGSINPIFIYVPIEEAPSFDAQFHELEYSDIKFTLANGIYPVIYHLVITNPANGISYVYNSVDDIAFKSTQLDFNFNEVGLSLNDMVDKEQSQESKESTTVLNVGYPDVDTDIPISKGTSSNTYALIIGNEDYTKFQSDLNSEANVDFAKRDAEIFAEYTEKTLGVPKGNITLLTDAISSQMNREIDKLSKLAKYTDGEATIIFYFAGHGFPAFQFPC